MTAINAGTRCIESDEGQECPVVKIDGTKLTSGRGGGKLEGFKPHEIEIRLIQPGRIWHFEGVEKKVADCQMM
jgi:hypothetical protein